MNLDNLSQYRNLYIQLSEHHKCYYTSGDIISGTVRVTPTSRPWRVAITFKGLHALKILGSRSAEDRHPAIVKEETLLFTRTLELFTGETAGPSYDIVKLGVAEDSRVELPFTFTFPYTVELRPKNTFTFMREFEHRLGHLLPPTYTYEPPGPSLGTVDLRVEYFLEAQLCTKQKWSPETTMRQDLLYRPLKPESLSLNIDNIAYHARDQIIRTHRLDPNYNPKEGIFKKLKHGITKNAGSTPVVSFKVSANVPRIANILSDLPISLSLVWLERIPQYANHPSIYIRRICVRLVSSVSARVCHTDPLIGTEEYYALHRGEIALLNKSFGGLGEILYDGLLLRDLGLVKLGVDVVPGFKTFGLGLKYKIEVRLWGECAKEKFDLVACYGVVEIISNARVEYEIQPAVVQMEEEEGTAPPAYE